MEDAFFKIGYISRTHGLKGGLSIVLNKEAPEAKKIRSILVAIGGDLVPYIVEEFSDRTDKVFVRLDGITSLEVAEKLRGCSLYLPKTEREKSARGEFYDDEVTGFEVEDIRLGSLGKVKEILQMGPNRLLSIQGVRKELLVPVNGPFIQSLNKSKKKFVVDLPDGFLDI